MMTRGTNAVAYLTGRVTYCCETVTTVNGITTVTMETKDNDKRHKGGSTFDKEGHLLLQC